MVLSTASLNISLGLRDSNSRSDDSLLKQSQPTLNLTDFSSSGSSQCSSDSLNKGKCDIRMGRGISVWFLFLLLSFSLAFFNDCTAVLQRKHPSPSKAILFMITNGTSLIVLYSIALKASLNLFSRYGVTV